MFKEGSAAIGQTDRNIISYTNIERERDGEIEREGERE